MSPQIRPLTAELQQTAKDQLFEVPERIDADLEAFRTWINQQPHLTARTDDQHLIAFLRGCKYSLERAKAKFDKYYTLRTKYPDLFNILDVDNPRFREIHRLGAVLFLPTPLNGNGPRISIWRTGIYSADDYHFTEVMRIALAMQEISLLEDDYAMVNGVVFIMDLKGASAAHMLQMTPSLAKKMTVYSEEAVPFRPKAQHFLNTVTGFEAIFNLFKPMLSKKLQGRLFVHGNNLESLYEQVPLKYLPKEYGGENGSIEEIVSMWDKKFDEYSQYYKDNANYGTDETLRHGKPIDFEGLFGIEGSFRKLDVD